MFPPLFAMVWWSTFSYNLSVIKANSIPLGAYCLPSARFRDKAILLGSSACSWSTTPRDGRVRASGVLSGLEGIVDLWQVVGTQVPRDNHQEDPNHIRAAYEQVRIRLKDASIQGFQVDVNLATTPPKSSDAYLG